MSSLYNLAASIADTFEKAFCMTCFVVGIGEQDDYACRKRYPYCAACAKEQLKRKKQLQCENVHRYGVLQAEKWGGKYEYLCPAGLAFICAVMHKYTEAKYGVTAGPFLMVSLKDFGEEDIERFFGTPVAVLEEEAKKLPYFSSGRVTYIANILSAVAMYAAEKDIFQLKIMEQVAKSQNAVYDSLYKLKDTQAESYKYPIEHERRLQSYIAQGDKAASQKVLNEILGHIFFYSGGDLDSIKARIIELVVILSRAAIEGGADISEVFGLNHDYIKDVQKFDSLDELNQWLAKVLVRFTNSVFDFSKTKHAEIIKKVFDYVRKNYMKKMSLNDISAYTNLSVSYLSKIFRDETGQSLNAYINQMRIENAKLFLLDANMPLTDVAYLSGFEDQSYFSKVFKKIVGLTPGKYRQKRTQ